MSRSWSDSFRYVVVVSALSACGATGGSSGDTLPEPVAISIDGDWVATALTVDGVAVTVNPPLVSMSISGAHATGAAACNSYGGTVTVGEDGSFALTDVAVTEMACEPPAIMDIERAVLGSFVEVTTFVLSDELVLSSADGATSMTLIRVEIPASTVASAGASLDGSWSAISASVGVAELGDFESLPVTMSIGSGRMVGASGCNSDEVAIDVQGDTITFGARSSTEAGCSGPPAEVENLFRTLTSGTATWSVAGDLLTLTNGDAVWVFERSGDAPTAPATTAPLATPAPTAPDLFGGLDGPVMFAGPDAAVTVEDTAVGTLFLGDNCLGIMRDDGVTIALVVWPYGTRWQPDGSGVVLPSGEVLGFGPVVQVDGAVIDDAELPAYTDDPDVHDEIARCRRTDQTLLFVAA